MELDGWDPREDTGYPPTVGMPTPDLVHVAGVMVTAENPWRQRQRCAWCAVILVEAGPGPLAEVPRVPWPAGRYVAQAEVTVTEHDWDSGAVPKIYPEIHRWMMTETDDMPAGLLCSDRGDDD